MNAQPAKRTSAGAAPSASSTGPWLVALGAIGIGVASALMAALGDAPRVRMRQPSPESSVLALSIERVGITPFVWAVAGATVPLWVWFARRFPFAPGRRAVSACVHASAVLLVAHAVGSAVVSFDAGRPIWLPLMVRQLAAWSLPFVGVVAAVHAFAAQARSRAREGETARLRAELAETRLQVLSARLQPHFLFNTLQAISTLIHRDAAKADRMLGALGELLRECLVREPRVFHSLGEELELLERYMEICLLRVGERLSFERDVDADVRAARVPVFVLQPLAENAIEHGVARCAGEGRVVVFARREGATLRFGIVDDGAGLAESGAEREGVGLGATRARLRELFGADASLELSPAEPRGVRAELRFPFDVERDGGQP